MNKISDILYMSINSIYIIKKVVYSCHFSISAPAPMLQKTKSPSPPSRFCNPRVCTDWKNRALLGFNSAIQIPRKSKKDRPNFVNGISSYVYIYILYTYLDHQFLCTMMISLDTDQWKLDTSNLGLASSLIWAWFWQTNNKVIKRMASTKHFR